MENIYEVIYRDPSSGDVNVQHTRPISDNRLALLVEALNATAEIMGEECPYRLRIDGHEFKSLNEYFTPPNRPSSEQT